MCQVIHDWFCAKIWIKLFYYEWSWAGMPDPVCDSTITPMEGRGSWESVTVIVFVHLVAQILTVDSLREQIQDQWEIGNTEGLV
jgi:hypothetical protein